MSGRELQNAAVSGDDRPWERPGAVRRDRVPHRGLLLCASGVTAVGLSVLALPLIVPGIFALPLAHIVGAMARHDLAEIRGGRMDPAGRRAAGEARFMSRCTWIITLAAWLWWGLYVLVQALLQSPG